ncbi:GGDEF domain-containing protein [Erythrobacter sp. SCSIO 43205]|uniref:GGDEF domain-containing protein n=1 Tax=Erythrobacter sp. SCSIO 43205 TaxID=2779361 RepID=UPI001CA8B14E|nr:GGDEF domain-containing protein [Erythrobacter sp. SCSIO 43205]UAB79547.1 GGDEF domain-containing protein [Erythrobacter sp. SCSIO 43205]
MQTQILGLLTPLMALLFAVTFALFWKLGAMRRHVLGFAIGYVFFAAGYLVTHLAPPDALYLFHATQLLYSIAVFLMLFSVCERVGQRINLPLMAGIYGVSALALAIAVGVTNDVAPRLIIVNTGYGAMYMVGLATLLMAPRRGPVDHAILAVIALGAIDFLVRPNLTLMYQSSIPDQAYRESFYYSIIGLVLGVKSVLGAMVLMGATIFEWTTSLRESSEADPLTGLQNRAAFEETMHAILPKAQSEGRPLSLVVADIDHFKQVNDIWGHQSGDKAISSFGKLINEMVRNCDKAGRIGGEEFCIAAYNCPNEPAERLAERIRQAFAQLAHEGLSNDIRLTASFGVATAAEGETYEQLFARADAALYKAKSNGRNRVENAERPSPITTSIPAMAQAEPVTERRA